MKRKISLQTFMNGVSSLNEFLLLRLHVKVFFYFNLLFSTACDFLFSVYVNKIKKMTALSYLVKI